MLVVAAFGAAIGAVVVKPGATTVVTDQGRQCRSTQPDTCEHLVPVHLDGAAPTPS